MIIIKNSSIFKNETITILVTDISKIRRDWSEVIITFRNGDQRIFDLTFSSNAESFERQLINAMSHAGYSLPTVIVREYESPFRIPSVPVIVVRDRYNEYSQVGEAVGRLIGLGIDAAVDYGIQKKRSRR